MKKLLLQLIGFTSIFWLLCLSRFHSLWHAKPVKWSVYGLMLELIGVILLFIFGMPFRVPSGGAIFLVTGNINEGEIATNKLFLLVSYIGLIGVVCGTLCQVRAAYLSHAE